MNKHVYGKNFPKSEGVSLEKTPKELSVLPFSMIPENKKDLFLVNLSYAYRDIFGHGKSVDKSGWGEYLICNNCSNQKSIEDATGEVEYRFLCDTESKNTPINSNCDNCGSEMEYFHDPVSIITETRQQMSEKAFYGASIIDDDLRVYGFIYSWIDSVKRIWEEKINDLYNITPDQLKYSDFINQITQKTRGKINESTNVLYLAEVGLIQPARNQKALFEMFRAMFSEFEEEVYNIPTLVTSEEDKRSYMLLEGADHDVVCETENYSLKTLSGNVRKLVQEWSLSPDEFFKKHENVIKRWQVRIKK
ncbi:MAG: hypothetical protein N4A36_03980 [Candidatus Gracilibacteria bacterium]|jgi:hypothetical protein|nr:hypothetical protein [Candidatus Gracilibacteria bacterium]